MLLQVMSEERATGFVAEDTSDGLRRIVSIGSDPWQVRVLQGRVTFKNHPPSRVTILDHSRQRVRPIQLSDGTLNLDAQTLYYLIER